MSGNNRKPQQNSQMLYRNRDAVRPTCGAIITQTTETELERMDQRLLCECECTRRDELL